MRHPRLVHEHEARAVAREDREQPRADPRPVPDLDRVAEVGRQVGEEQVEPLEERPPRGERRLLKYGNWSDERPAAAARASPSRTRKPLRTAAVRVDVEDLRGVRFRPFAAVADRPRELRRHREALGGALAPREDHVAVGGMVVGRVRLHRVERLRVLGEERLGLRARRVERADPLLRRPRRRAEADVGAHGRPFSRALTRAVRSFTCSAILGIRPVSAWRCLISSRGRAGVPQ